MGDVNINQDNPGSSNPQNDPQRGGAGDQGQRTPSDDSATRAPGVPASKPGGPDAPTPPGQTSPKSE